MLNDDTPPHPIPATPWYSDSETLLSFHHSESKVGGADGEKNRDPFKRQARVSESIRERYPRVGASLLKILEGGGPELGGHREEDARPPSITPIRFVLLPLYPRPPAHMESGVLVFQTHGLGSCEHASPQLPLCPESKYCLSSGFPHLDSDSLQPRVRHVRSAACHGPPGQFTRIPPHPLCPALLGSEQVGMGSPRASHYSPYGASVGGGLLRRLEASLIPLPLQYLALSQFVE